MLATELADFKSCAGLKRVLSTCAECLVAALLPPPAARGGRPFGSATPFRLAATGQYTDGDEAGT